MRILIRIINCYCNHIIILYIDYSNDKEIIVLSSQIAGENTIVLNTWLNKEDAHSYNLPYIPPCIAETLNESQMQGMCLNPYLRNRFELCNTGSTLVADLKKGGVYHFLQNSIGIVLYIIFHRDLYIMQFFISF